MQTDEETWPPHYELLLQLCV